MSDKSGAGDVAEIVREIVASIERIDRMGCEEIVKAAEVFGEKNLLWIATDAANADCEITSKETGQVVWRGSNIAAVGDWCSLNGYSDAFNRFKSMHLKVVACLREFQRWAREEMSLEFDDGEALSDRRSAVEDVLGDFIRFGGLFAAAIEPNASSPQAPAKNGAIAIPPEFRSKPITKKLAAALLGRPNEDSGVKWLKACIDDGTIHCEELTKQSFVFDIRQFPESGHPKLLPPKSR
jgi:hypothetical protein